MDVSIREITESDYPQIVTIFLHGIATKNATFETGALKDWDAWDKKYLAKCRILAEVDGVVVGWVALTAVSARACYSGVCDVSIYIGEGWSGKGIGKRLLKELIEESEKSNIWTLQAGVFPENKASIKIHVDSGFREVGHRERIGQMSDGTWRNTVLLERRSKVVGV